MKNKGLYVIVAIILVIAAITGWFLLKNDKPTKEIEKETYKVIFDTAGGTPVEEQVIKEGENVKEPIEPTKENHIFIEWQLDGELFDFSAKIEKDITLVAKWEEEKKEAETVKKYTVKFDSNGGSSVKSQTVVEGKTATKPANPKKSNYKFVGWKLEGKKYDFNSKVTKNITLKASWEKIETETEPEKETVTAKKYTVKFDSNGGSSVKSQTVVEGKTATKPANPTKKDYTFSGWTLDGKTYNFSTKVTKNITLKASWKKVETEPETKPEVKPETKYTVTFNSNGGSSVSSQTVIEGKTATKPTNPTKNGYTFSGWTLDGKAYDFNSKVTKNITLKASWKQKNYTIKAAAVDSQSPARILSVYENGTKINVKSIKYSDGTVLCSGSNMNVNMYALDETSYKVVLTDGTEVNATLVS